MNATTKIKILPELKNLIPPLTPEEYAQLEANCIQYGIQDKLKIARYPESETGEQLEALADGHNRYKIAQSNGLAFEVEYLDFEDLNAVEVWMIKNQFGRRNLPAFIKGELALELEKRLRPKAIENKKIAAAKMNGDDSFFHNCEKTIDPINVTKEIATAAGVSHNTIARIKKIKKAADAKTIEKLRNQEISINKAYGVVRKNEQREKRKQQAEQARQIEIKKTLVDFRHGDFVEVFADVPDNSIDLILTDPPYPYEYIEQWSRLSSFAARVLKPNGFCIAYSGHLHLPEVMNRMGENLDWYWMLSLNHAGFGEHFFSRNMRVKWKPILIYQKGYSRYKPSGKDTLIDVIEGTGMAKKNHDWEQSAGEIIPLIEYFTNPGDTILEPFAGSGTTLIVSANLGRKAIGAEVEESTYLLAKKRIADDVV